MALECPLDRTQVGIGGRIVVGLRDSEPRHRRAASGEAGSASLDFRPDRIGDRATL